MAKSHKPKNLLDYRRQSASVLLSCPSWYTMKLQTEINGLIIFCFCLLATSLSKAMMSVFSELNARATELFDAYDETCWSSERASFFPINERMKRIPNCLEFDQKVLEPYCNASCSFRSIFRSVLSKNRDPPFSLCNKSEFNYSVEANIRQLNVLIHKVLCNCPQQQKEMRPNKLTLSPEERTYFWLVFQRYEKCMKQLNMFMEKRNMTG